MAVEPHQPVAPGFFSAAGRSSAEDLPTFRELAAGPLTKVGKKLPFRSPQPFSAHE
jgi:hypothetical protein